MIGCYSRNSHSRACSLSRWRERARVRVDSSAIWRRAEVLFVKPITLTPDPSPASGRGGNLTRPQTSFAINL
jgi:hypothetical protein